MVKHLFYTVGSWKWDMKRNLKNLCHKTGYKISQHKPLYIQRPDFMNSEKKLNQFYFELGQADFSFSINMAPDLKKQLVVEPRRRSWTTSFVRLFKFEWKFEWKHFEESSRNPYFFFTHFFGLICLVALISWPWYAHWPDIGIILACIPQTRDVGKRIKNVFSHVV